jgi:hypothetical protein
MPGGHKVAAALFAAGLAGRATLRHHGGMNLWLDLEPAAMWRHP